MTGAGRPEPRRRVPLWLPRAALLVATVLAVVLAVHLGLIGFLRDGDRVESFLTDSGALGPVVYVLAFVAAQPLNIPGVALIIPATFVWSSPTVFALSWIGGMVASTVGFVVARWIAQDWVQAHLPDRLLVWEDRIDDRGTLAVILLRVATGFAPAADWLLGVSTVTWRQFLVGTSIGLIPSTFMSSFLGDDAVRLVADRPILFAALAAVALVVVTWAQARRRRIKRSQVRAMRADVEPGEGRP